MTSKNIGAPLLYYNKLCTRFQSHQWIKTGVTVPKCSIRVKIGDLFVPCALEICRMTLRNYREPLLYHVKLCASFWSHLWIQTRVTVGKLSIWVKIEDYFAPYELDRWPGKTIGCFLFMMHPRTDYLVIPVLFLLCGLSHIGDIFIKCFLKEKCHL